MLGYVMDGNVSTAQSKVYAAIKSNKCNIGLTAGPVKDQEIGSVKRFVSCHLRSGSGNEIEIRHALLPF